MTIFSDPAIAMASPQLSTRSGARTRAYLNGQNDEARAVVETRAKFLEAWWAKQGSVPLPLSQEKRDQQRQKRLPIAEERLAKARQGLTSTDIKEEAGSARAYGADEEGRTRQEERHTAQGEGQTVKEASDADEEGTAQEVSLEAAPQQDHCPCQICRFSVAHSWLCAASSKTDPGREDECYIADLGTQDGMDDGGNQQAAPQPDPDHGPSHGVEEAASCDEPPALTGLVNARRYLLPLSGAVKHLLSTAKQHKLPQPALDILYRQLESKSGWYGEVELRVRNVINAGQEPDYSRVVEDLECAAGLLLKCLTGTDQDPGDEPSPCCICDGDRRAAGRGFCAGREARMNICRS